MPLIEAADYDAMLAAAGGGDVVILGSYVVPCMIGAQDTEELQDLATGKMWGTPVAYESKPLLVTVRTGAVPGLVAGTIVVIRRAGHERGDQYVVDHTLRTRDDSLTHFYAYAVPA